MKVNEIKIDVTYEIGKAGRAKLRTDPDPMRLHKRLSLLEGVRGVGFNPTSISLHINADRQTATEAIRIGLEIINEELQK